MKQTQIIRLILAVLPLIRFGEVGQRFDKEFLTTGQFDVATYDTLFNNSPEGTPLRDKARAEG